MGMLLFYLSIIWFHSCISKNAYYFLGILCTLGNAFCETTEGGKNTETKKNPKLPGSIENFFRFNRLNLMFFVSRSQTHKSARNDRSQEKNNRNCDHHTESRRR